MGLGCSSSAPGCKTATRRYWDDLNRLQSIATFERNRGAQCEALAREQFERELPEAETKGALNNQTVHQKPELNPVEWAGFKSTLSQESKDLFVINILRGEPVITFEHPTVPRRDWKSRRHPMVTPEGKAKPRKAGSKAKQQSIPGQAPLPERIRVNSMHILKVFEEIHGEAIYARHRM